tara:strand:+ start:345 stop:503 length:159 start_codon:yes stop_codon:yes gene_type:complete
MTTITTVPDDDRFRRTLCQARIRRIYETTGTSTTGYMTTASTSTGNHQNVRG